MRCPPVQARLSAYLDNELAPSWRRAVHGHLLGCDACRTAANELDALRGQLRAMPAPELPTHLFSRIEQTLAAQDAAHSQAPVLMQTMRAWWAAWRRQRGMRLGVGLVAVAGTAMLVATWGGAKHDASTSSASRVADVADVVDVADLIGDEEATTAYLDVVAQLRGELRRTLRIDADADVAVWRDVQATLAEFDRALAATTDDGQRRMLASAIAAHLGDVLAQHRTDALIARASW